ncbi:MAG: ribonuclease J [Ruthenibacterium sp.]
MPRGYAQRQARARRGKRCAGEDYPGGLGKWAKTPRCIRQGDMILVDCGIVFPDSDMYGIDLVIPDFSYVVENKEHIKGVLITHGHEDHIGALPYLLKKVDLPIYATRLTIGLIKNKLEEHGLLRSTKLIEITPKRKIRLGCFTVEPIHVNHSIPDAVGFAIECPAGVILQTGDFKVDYTPISGGPTDLVTIGEYGKKGVLALLSDSTNSERPGFTSTELKVGQSFATLFQRRRKAHHHCHVRLERLPHPANHRPGRGGRAQGGRQRPQHGEQHPDGAGAGLPARAGGCAD